MLFTHIMAATIATSTFGMASRWEVGTSQTHRNKRTEAYLKERTKSGLGKCTNGAFREWIMVFRKGPLMNHGGPLL